MRADAPETVRPMLSRIRHHLPDGGALRHGLPAISFALPDVVAEVGAAERATRCLVGQDVCILDGTRYYVRCRLAVPILDYEEPLVWMIWCRVSWRTCAAISSAGKFGGEERHVTAEGLLANRLADFPRTDGLASTIRFRNTGGQAEARINSERHKLGRLQRHGMTASDAIAQARRSGALLVFG